MKKTILLLITILAVPLLAAGQVLQVTTCKYECG